MKGEHGPCYGVGAIPRHGGVPCSCCPLYCPTCPPQRTYLADLLPQLAGLPGRPTYRHLARFGDRCPHPTAGRRPGPATGRSTWRGCAGGALQARLGPATAPAQERAQAGGSAGAGTTARAGWPASSTPVGPGPEGALFVSRPRACSPRPPDPAGGARSRPPRAEVGAMLALHGALPWRTGPTSIFVGDGIRLRAHGQGVGRTGPGAGEQAAPRAALFVPWTEPPTGRPGRPRKYAGFDRARIGELLSSSGRGQAADHAQLYYKPFKKLVVFVLRGRGSRRGDGRPPCSAPTPRWSRNGFIAYTAVSRSSSTSDAKQHLGLAASRPAAGHHFHVLSALAWTRLELRHAAREGPGQLFDGQLSSQKLPGNGPAKAGGGRATCNRSLALGGKSTQAHLKQRTPTPGRDLVAQRPRPCGGRMWPRPDSLARSHHSWSGSRSLGGDEPATKLLDSWEGTVLCTPNEVWGRAPETVAVAHAGAMVPDRSTKSGAEPQRQGPKA